MVKKKTDIFFMRRALILARRGCGTTSPNPMVGCVIVKRGRIIAEGWHKFCGGDHAEVDALKKAGSKARGATMYVTLEPCSHWGRTPPCVEAILQAGISKVVVAMRDPNPVNNGRSLRILRRRGVKVLTGVLQDEARDLNAAFIKYITRKMPFVIVKSAQTLDGKITTGRGGPRWITAAATRAWARAKRQEFDAILVGIETVLMDDPQLNAPAKRLWKIVLDSKLRIPERARLLQASGSSQVILATTAHASVAKVKRLEKRGVRVIVCSSRGGQVDMKWLFKELAKNEIASILIEGGAAVIRSALKGGLVDGLHVYVAPKVLTEKQKKTAIAGLDLVEMVARFNFSLQQMSRIGPDLLLKFNH